MKSDLVAVDLFAGAGGTSTVLVRAAESLGLRVSLLAINHWEVAVETHAANHPDAEHLCTGLDAVDPRAVVAAGVEALEAGRRDVLVLYDGGIVATAPQLRDAATDRAARVELEQDLELLRRETRRQAALTTDELLDEIRPQIRRILLLEGSA